MNTPLPVPLCAVASLLIGCATADPPLSLADRFEVVAFEAEDPFFDDQLWKWTWPIRVQFIGSEVYRDLAMEHLAQLSELIGQPVVLNSARPNLTIEFTTLNPISFCSVRVIGEPHDYIARVYIGTDQPTHHIHRCIVQELSQAMGLIADTDGRRDTAFSSGIGTDYLTEADLALFAILYDHRLRAGMSRDEVLAVLPEIVSDLEAAQ